MATERRKLLLIGHGNLPVRGIRSSQIGTYEPKFALFGKRRPRREYKDEKMASIELDYHANMVVLCQHDAIINQLGKNVDVRPFSSYCSKLESVPNIYDVVVYD